MQALTAPALKDHLKMGQSDRNRLKFCSTTVDEHDHDRDDAKHIFIYLFFFFFFFFCSVFFITNEILH